jgi:predicted ATPase/DNA-binding CsgD family transcriptional regulator
MSSEPIHQVSGNLPRELTSFVGRRAQLADIAEVLQTAPLLTLVGMGGVGKTRLATRAARAAGERYAHGPWLVELASIGDPAGVAAEVARALAIRERPGWSTLDTLRSALRTRQLLLVLDNCEHVLAACAELVALLLQSCPELCILATSRERLGVAGERIYHVPPLALTNTRESSTRLWTSEAIDLFVDRARAIEPGLELTDRAAATVARICQILEGQPLAIELAAARMTTMGPGEVARRLDAPLALLTHGPRSAPARQQSLRAAIDWSYQLLTEAEQTLLRRLALFRGGFSREAAKTVCADSALPAEEVDDLLDRLVAQSVLVSARRQETTRFSMLEMVRQYCWGRLEEAGEVTRLRERHRDWCIGLVQRFAVESHLAPARDAEPSRRLETLVLRGTIAIESGDRTAAASVLLEALDLALLFGSGIRLARLLEALAALLVEWQPYGCVRMAAAAEQLRITLRAVPRPSERQRLGRYLQTARLRLGQQRYSEAWKAAPTVPLDETLLDARELVLGFQAGRRPDGAQAFSSADALSPREREVATLVTGGLSNREIAEQLAFTDKTAEAHVAHILNKLGLTNRVQIATWWMRHGAVTASTPVAAERVRALHA